MPDVSVTINPPSSTVVNVDDTARATTVNVGNSVYPHAAIHAPGGSDSLEGYFYPRSNPSGYITSGDSATTGYV